MKKRNLRIIVVVFVLVLVAGLAWGWWYLAMGRFPLSGSLRHDFGVIEMVDGKAAAEHTFHLTNRTGAPVVIEEIRPNCGCTVAEASTMLVAPGESVDIDVTFTLVRAKEKKTSVSLLIRDFGVQTLFVRGER